MATVVRYQYTFSHPDDWSVPYRLTWYGTPALTSRIGKKIRYLEVGIFEGRSAVFMLGDILTHPESTYLGVDPWEGDFYAPAEALARANIGQHEAHRWKIIKGHSPAVFFNDPSFYPGAFDVGYVDGGHVPRDALRDVVFVWEMLDRYGVLIVDDYNMPWVASG